MAHNKLHHSNLNEFALDEHARVFFDLQHLTEDSVPKDDILSRKKNEKDSKEERQDLNPSLSVTEEEDSDETGQRNVNNSLNNSHFESLTDMSQLSEAYDDSLKKKRQKAKGSTKKWNVEKKTSEAFQPFIPKPKTFTGSATGNKKTSQKMTFKTKPKISSSSSNRKSRSRFSKPPCKHCENCNGNKKGSPCIKYYFTNLFKNSNETISIEDGLLKIEERKTKNKKIGLDAGKVNEDISDCINGEETFSADAKNGKSSKIYQNEPILTIKVEQREPTNNGDVPNADSAESNGKSKIRNKRKSIPIKRPIKEIFPKRLERRTTEESSKLVEIVKSPQENHLTQKDAKKIAVTNHVQFIKRKTSKIPSKKLSQIIQTVESGSEGSKHVLDMPLFSDSYSDEHNQNQEETKKMDKICAIAEQKIGENHTEEVQAQQSEEKMKTLDEISIIINNKENNKSRRALRMLELFGSCSEDSDQSVDYNIHDDNNNTHVNSAQPYLLMKELHQTDQDDCHAPLKKLKYSSEGIEMPQIDLHKRREPRHRKNQTKVNKKHLNKMINLICYPAMLRKILMVLIS